jgi:predicted nucleic acid-binding protein
MTIVDSGPLAALYLPSDQHHKLCAECVVRLSPPMVTTKSCFTEAMYFVGKERGWRGQENLWQLVVDGRLEVQPFSQDDLDRMRELMEKYQDAPMDLADASLVVLAENLGETLVFTIDSHFRTYRLRDRRALNVVPGS